MDDKTVETMLKICDERYMQKDACNDRHNETDKTINSIALTQVKNTTYLSILVKVQGATFGALLTIIVGKICEMIMK